MRARDADHASRLVGFSLARPVAVSVLLASTLVLGLISVLMIPVELVPKGFTAPFLRVMVPWRDAPAPEVLDKVVRPLEEELATISGVDGMRSVALTGAGRIFLTFKQGTDMDTAYREVRDRVQRARRRLPEDVERVFIRKDDETGIPIYVIGLAVDESLHDAHDLIQNEVILPLERVDGVASVTADGLVEKEILVELDRARAAAAGVNIWQLAQQLGADSFTMASGQVRTGDRKLALRSQATYQTLEELAARPVSPTASLGDIARISYAEPDLKFRLRANSRPAVAVVVRKAGEANTLEVAGRVERELERLRANPRLAGMGTAELFSQRKVILESLDNLVGNGRVGALFAVAVLFFFLRRLRMTVILTLSIPLSILISLSVMFLWGESLNIVSLLGLMISVGLLVDNSVVVAENIVRLHRQGLPRREAVLAGASQIALAIVMATLTTIVVFLPASLVEGQGQFFLLRLAVPISVALAASLLVALILVPLAIYWTLPADRAAGDTSAGNGAGERGNRLQRVLGQAYEATFGRLNRAYGRLLGLALARRAELLMALVLLFVLTNVVFSKQVKFTPVQEEERGGFQVGVELPQTTTFKEAEEYFLACEKVVESMAGELDLAGWFLFHRTSVGRLEGWFNTPRTNKVTPRQATERLLEVLPEKAGVRLTTGDESETETLDEQVFSLRLFADDPERLEAVAVEVEKLLTAVPGVLGVKKVADRPNEELALRVDRERTRAAGVDPRALAGVVGYALRGQALPRASYGGRQIPVRVRFQEEDRSSLADLFDFAVPSASGDPIRLGALAEPELLPTAQMIWRTDKRTSRTVTLDLAEGSEKETRERLTALLRQLQLPEGVTRDLRGTAEQSEDLRGIQLALLFSVILIYLLMAFLFESFVLPLSIVTTMPLAFVGVAWAHILAGRNIDFLGAVGGVLLVGVVVNNGIVLVDYTQRLRAVGQSRPEALELAAHRRFRPIMMTALTTICGMLPLLAGGRTSLGLSYTSFGLTLVGGMTTATLLTLLVVPVFYTLFDDLRLAIRQLVGWAGGAIGRRLDPTTSTRPALEGQNANP